MTNLIPAPKNADLSHIAPRLRSNAVLLESLILDPKNPRQGDTELIAKSLDRHGQQQPVIVYRFPVSQQHPKDGYTVIAGNHRCKAALLELKYEINKKPKIKKPWEYISVSEYTGTPEEAQEYAIIDNRSSDVAEYDDKILAEHLRNISEANAGTDLYDLTGYDKNDLTYYLSRMEISEEQKDIYASSETSPDLQKEIYSEVKKEKDAIKDVDNESTAPSFKFATALGYLNNGVSKEYPIFPHSDSYGIPDLLPDMLAEVPDKPVRIWPGLTNKTEKYIKKYDALKEYWMVNFGYSSQNCPFERAYLCFYALDEAFESVYQNPLKFLKNFKNANLKGIVEPDYSMWDNEPFATNLWALYRQRWTARLFQEVGIKIIPCVGASEENLHMYDSLPGKIPVVAMQLQTGLKKRSKYEVRFYHRNVNLLLQNVNFDCIMLYGSKFGHEISQNWFPKQLHVIRIATVQDVRRQTYKKDPLRSTKTKDYN